MSEAQTHLPVTFREANNALRHDTGIIIPVYFPEGVDAGIAESLLEDAVTGFCRQVADPSDVCLSVDGGELGAETAERIAREFCVSTWIAPRNRGKLHGARNGARCLLERRSFKYLAVVDQDGDHFPNELLNFVRAAEHIRIHSGTDQVLVLGRRSSRHRPLGFLRAEQEELANRLLLDALRYHASISGQPLRLEYSTTLDLIPDFHSGYKLFSRDTAASVLLGEPQLAGVSGDCYYRHAAEAVMVLESLVRGAHLGVVNRSTFNEQPVSTFGLYDRCQLVADMIIWPCRRLDVPLHFVRQWLANGAPPPLLNTLVPEGKRELVRISELVLSGLGGEGDRGTPSASWPLFV